MKWLMIGKHRSLSSHRLNFHRVLHFFHLLTSHFISLTFFNRLKYDLQLESIVPQEENLKFTTGWDIKAREAIRNAVKLKRQLIDDVLSDIANFFGKSVGIKHIQTTPPSKIFDELKRAEQYDDPEQPKYKTAATRLRDLLISRINGLLDNVSQFLEYDEKESSTCKDRQVSTMIVTQSHDSQEQSSDSCSPRNFSTTLSEDISDLEDCEDLISSIEMFAPHLPAVLIEVYQPRLYELRSMVGSAKRAHMLQIEEVISSDADAFHNLKELFNFHMRKGDRYYMKETADALNKLLKDLAEKVSNDLRVGKLWLAVTTLLPSFQHWSQYINELNHLQSYPIYENLVNSIGRAIRGRKKSKSTVSHHPLDSTISWMKLNVLSIRHIR